MSEGRVKTCEHAIFDELWGEYRCKYYESTLYITTVCERCEHYKEKKKVEKDANRNTSTSI